MKIFILTGAGISAESGIRTYRSETGLWSENRIDDIATPAGFARNPGLVRTFYDQRHVEIMKAHPNAAHEALARLEAQDGMEVTIVTQNIDDLHERAGSRRVLHIHGSVKEAICARCAAVSDQAGSLSSAPPCPECGGIIRPDIVWFGEEPKWIFEIEDAFLAADLFISIGTSGEVWPAAGYARRARNRKVEAVEFNMRETAISPYFRHRRRGPASETVPAFVAKLIAREPQPEDERRFRL